MWQLIVLFVAGAYVGWSVGANDAGDCIGTSVGSGLLSYRRAIVLVALFVVIGALLQGENVMETVGKGIVTVELPASAIFAAMFSAGLFVTLATFFKLPVSTSQAIVGGVVGVGLAAGVDVNLSKLVTIAEVWVICPFLTGILAFVFYHGLAFLLRRLRRPRLWDHALEVLLILSACYVSFSLGANDVGNSVGPIANLGVSPTWLLLLGGVSLAVGALTFGRRVTETVGGGIVRLDPLSAVCAQASAAVAVHFFSILGIPVSTTQAIVGAVVGVGLVKGMRAIKGQRVAGIVVGWIGTPTTSGLVAFGVYKLILFVM